MRNPMELSLTQAASASGRSKSTINRAIKDGRLSAIKHEDGSYSIQPAELFRVYPKNPTETGSVTHHATPQKPQTEPHPPSLQEALQEALRRADVMSERAAQLTAQQERDQATIDDLRRRLDKAEDRILALAAPVPQPATPASSAPTFFGRLFGRR